MSRHDTATEGRAGGTIRSAARTDVGRVRERNEDAFITSSTVFAVADGLGGHRAGEVASRAALEPLAALAARPPQLAARDLASSVRSGNRTVYERAQDDPALRGMGTTLTAVAISNGTAHLAHVGDSRCYLIRDGSIVQLTDDHTVVARMVAEGRLTQEQAESHPQRSLLLRALGAESIVEVDETQVELAPGDRLLLCSDGLYAVVSDEEILEVAGSSPDLDDICGQLVDMANERGGPDNITVVLIEIGEGAGDPPPAAPAPVAVPRVRRPRVQFPIHISPRLVIWGLVVVAVALTAFFVLRSVVHQSFFVGVQDGQVAVFRGLPASGLRGLSSVEERTGIPIEEVRADFRRKLEEGLRAESLAGAREIVDNLPRMRPTPAQSTPPPGDSP